MPDKPSYEDVERQLGLDKMSFMSDMVRPDQHEEREEDPALQQQSNSADRASAEQKLIDVLEYSHGRKLTPQEVNLALRQAREIGEL